MFASRLRSLRLENKLTQKELAKKLNMQNTAISKYELGEREPDIETFNKLAKFFDVSLDYLLGRTDIKNPEDGNKESNIKANEFWDKLKKRMAEEGMEFDKTSPEDMILAYKIAKEFEKSRKSN